MNWPSVPFSELFAAPSRNGLTRPSRVRGAGFKMINMGELFAHDRIRDINMELVPMSERELDLMLVEQGDLLFARQSLVLSGAGKCSIVVDTTEPTTFESHIIRVRLRRDKANPLFYYYYFRSPMSGMKGIVTQGVQAGIRGSDLKGLAVHVPDLDEQDRIARVLSAYDDLIENNRRRIALLEDGARQLYNEWFVRLRFPGHEHAEKIDGVPEGWRWKAVGGVADDVSYGYTASADPDIEGPKFLRITDIVKGQISWPDVPRCPISDTKASRFALAQGDVVVARTGATTAWARRIGRLREQAVFASYLVRFRFGKQVHPTLAALFMESDTYKAMVWAGIGGAAQPNASAQLLGKPKFLVPTEDLQSAFAEEVEPSYVLIDVLMEQNYNLLRARDLLLPKLMNGTLTV